MCERMQIHPWTIWLFWSSPLMYAMQALSVNEFTAGLHISTELVLATEICINYTTLNQRSDMAYGCGLTFCLL